MNTIKEKLSGVFPPMMTPFHEDQTLDMDSLIFNVEKYNETDIRGMMPLGSNGEFRALDDDESIAVVKAVKTHLKADKTLMVGAGRESSYSTVEFAKRAAGEGADFISLLTPFYFKSRMTDDALLGYYSYVADRSPVPVMIYCAPKFTGGLLISPEVVAKLADHPNIVGMKDTSAEPSDSYTKAVEGKDFFVLAGTINKYIDALRCGGIGGVLSAANYLPQQCCEIQQLYEAGQEEAAAALSAKLRALTSACSGKTGIPGTKACMTVMGFRGGLPRLPLTPVGDAEIAGIRSELEKAGYL